MPRTVTAAPVELAEVVRTVFDAMLHMNVVALPGGPAPNGDMVTAAVYLTGGYQGAILLHCPAWQACGFAGQVLDKTPPSEVNDDVLDVMGELVNVIAGNLKSTLVPGTHLSIPSVTQGADSVLRLCGSRPLQREAFSSPLGPFSITMFTSGGK